MGTAMDLEPLLAAPIAEAAARLERAGTPFRLVRSVPPRPRHPFPPDDAWRVARARLAGDVVELVIVPALPMPEATPSPSQ